jgi:hypothetical protein
LLASRPAHTPDNAESSTLRGSFIRGTILEHQRCFKQGQVLSEVLSLDDEGKSNKPPVLTVRHRLLTDTSGLSLKVLERQSSALAPADASFKYRLVPKTTPAGYAS